MVHLKSCISSRLAAAILCAVFVLLLCHCSKNNDSPENLEATARFIAGKLSNAIPVHLLPYHRLGEAKWERLGRKNETASIKIPDERQLEECRRIFESFGLTAIMGG